MRRIATVVFALAFPQGVMAAQSECGGSTTIADYSPERVKEATDFLASLQKATAADDKVALSKMVAYPTLINHVKGVRTLAGPGQFLRHYKRIFTPAMRRAIMEQKAKCLFANWHGVMIGNGQVWFDHDQGPGMKINTFNVP